MAVNNGSRPGIMKKALCCCLLPVVALLLFARSTVAEKAPMSPKKLRSGSTHVLTGKVQAVYSRQEVKGDWTYTRYVAEIVVASVEKGKGPEKGKPTYVRYWKRKYRGLFPPPSIYGHSGLPSAGDEVRVFLAQRANDGYGHVNKDGGLDVLGPNGFQKLTKQN